MRRIWIERVCLILLLVAAAVTPLAAQEGGRGEPDPDVWVGSVLAELADPGFYYPFTAGAEIPFSLLTLTGMPPAPKQRAEGSYVENGVYYRGRLKRGRRREHILVDEAGPGVLVRLSFTQTEGNLRIYVDGAAEPVIDMECAAIFGGHQRFYQRPLAERMGSRAALKLPIPFKKSVRVTLDGKAVPFEADIRRYDKKVDLESFRPERGVEAIFRTEHILKSVVKKANPPEPLPQSPKQAVVIPRPDFGGTVDWREPTTLIERNDEKPGVLAAISLDTVKPWAIEQVLDKLMLYIDCDGEETLRLPFSHLFPPADTFMSGAAEIVPRVLRRSTFRLPMPYAKKIRVRARSTSGKALPDVRMQFEFRAPLPGEESWRLHGRFGRGEKTSSSFGLKLPHNGVLVGETITAENASALKDATLMDAVVSSEGAPRAGLMDRFSASPGTSSANCWGFVRWDGKRLHASRFRRLDRRPFDSDLLWEVQVPKVGGLVGFSAGLLYYTRVEKSEALPGSDGR